MGASPKNIGKPPTIAPGKGVADALHAGIYMVKSDTFAVGDTLPVLLFNVPKNTYVYDLVLNETAAFLDSGGATGGGTLIAGYTGDCDAFHSSTTLAATAGTYSMHGATGGVKKGGYLATGDVQIEASWATTCSVGGGQAILLFARYGDENFEDK